MPEAQIIRKAIIVVDTVAKNTYGDLTFTDKEGTGYKISNKRVQYFENTIQPDIGVELSYANAYGKEYIYSARQLKDGLPPPQPIKPTEREKVAVQEAHKTHDENLPPPNPQAVGMVTKELGDMIRTKYLKTIFGDETGIELIKWYRGQVLGITRVPFDGAKLPTFKKQPEMKEEDIP